jgi:hypothetical protein
MFKWSYSTRHLPTVNYLTSLDKYSICSLAFVYLCFTWHGIVNILYDFMDAQTVVIVDHVVLVILLSVYFIMQCVLLLWLKRAYTKRENYKRKDSEINLNHKIEFSNSLFLQNTSIDQQNLKRGSVFNFLNNIDQINHFRHQPRKNSVSDRVRNLIRVKSKSSLSPQAATNNEHNNDLEL